MEEREGLLSYMKSHSTSEESRRSAYADLSECEKYMLAMIDVEEAAEKFDCLLFRAQFRGRLDELVDSIRVVERACDEVRHSEKLREIMALILTLVNEINTGGDGNEAIGFSLDALLKLNEVRCMMWSQCFDLPLDVTAQTFPVPNIRPRLSIGRRVYCSTL